MVGWGVTIQLYTLSSLTLEQTLSHVDEGFSSVREVTEATYNLSLMSLY
jgi:hypothetical protein